MAYTKEAREAELLRLMRLYGDSIKRMCCVYLHDVSSAEDAAQETFIKAYAHMDSLLSGEIESERAWLCRIAINTCKDVLRSSWLRRIDLRKSIEELPLASPPPSAEHMALTESVASLPIKYKEIILLYYYQNLTMRMCADVLGISAATATRRLQKAQRILKTELERS